MTRRSLRIIFAILLWVSILAACERDGRSDVGEIDSAFYLRANPETGEIGAIFRANDEYAFSPSASRSDVASVRGDVRAFAWFKDETDSVVIVASSAVGERIQLAKLDADGAVSWVPDLSEDVLVETPDAIDVSPDGSMALVAGHEPTDRRAATSIYLVSLSTGEVVKALEGTTGTAYTVPRFLDETTFLSIELSLDDVAVDPVGVVRAGLAEGGVDAPAHSLVWTSNLVAGIEVLPSGSIALFSATQDGEPGRRLVSLRHPSTFEALMTPEREVGRYPTLVSDSRVCWIASRGASIGQIECGDVPGE